MPWFSIDLTVFNFVCYHGPSLSLMMVRSHQTLLKFLQLLNQLALARKWSERCRLVSIMKSKFLHSFNSPMIVESMHNWLCFVEGELIRDQSNSWISHNIIFHAEHLIVRFWAIYRSNINRISVLFVEFFPGRQELLAIIAPWGIEEDEPRAFEDQFVGININHIVVEVILG